MSHPAIIWKPLSSDHSDRIIWKPALSQRSLSLRSLRWSRFHRIATNAELVFQRSLRSYGHRDSSADFLCHCFQRSQSKNLAQNHLCQPTFLNRRFEFVKREKTSQNSTKFMQNRQNHRETGKMLFAVHNRITQ